MIHPGSDFGSGILLCANPCFHRETNDRAGRMLTLENRKEIKLCTDENNHKRWENSFRLCPSSRTMITRSGWQWPICCNAGWSVSGGGTGIHDAVTRAIEGADSSQSNPTASSQGILVTGVMTDLWGRETNSCHGLTRASGSPKEVNTASNRGRCYEYCEPYRPYAPQTD